MERDHRSYSNSARFAELQSAVGQLIDRLERDFVTDRIDGTNLDPVLAAEWPDLPSTRLRPPPEAAALTFIFGLEDFPGVDLHYGWGGRSLFPGCFCDECAETVQENLDRLGDVIDAVIAGQFSETRQRRLFGHDRYQSHRLDRSGSEGREDRLDPELGPLMPRGTTKWRPWTSRSVVS